MVSELIPNPPLALVIVLVSLVEQRDGDGLVTSHRFGAEYHEWAEYSNEWNALPAYFLAERVTRRRRGCQFN
jgi:hypothetical protein